MLAVIIPTYNVKDQLEILLAGLKDAQLPVIVADGGSRDQTLECALAAGASLAMGACGRGPQLILGANWAAQARSPDWYLFLHADSVLGEGWKLAVTLHMNNYPNSAGYFRFRARAKGWKPRLMEFCVRYRELTFGGPYGDQGLLISRELYERVGGYDPLRLFEDVAIIDRIKAKGKLRRLPANLYTDVSCYERDGYWARTQRNLSLLKAYRRGEDVDELHRSYMQPAAKKTTL
jgi:glycosyltransferase involved in cell wall biosynthesis